MPRDLALIETKDGKEEAGKRLWQVLRNTRLWLALEQLQAKERGGEVSEERGVFVPSP